MVATKGGRRIRSGWPKECPECEGAGEYAYHRDPTGEQQPYSWDNPVATGWHDGIWWKKCWWCGGTGIAHSGF